MGTQGCRQTHFCKWPVAQSLSISYPVLSFPNSWIPKSVPNRSPTRWLQTLLKSLGPGVITGAADDDPSGIATYSVAGAQLGTALLWTALLTLPLMAAVQLMCARIGMVTGRGMAANLKRRFPRWLLVILVFALLIDESITATANRPMPPRCISRRSKCDDDLDAAVREPSRADRTRKAAVFPKRAISPLIVSHLTYKTEWLNSFELL